MEMRKDFRRRNIVYDEHEPAASIFIGPVVEPLGLEHRVLCRLHDRRPIRSVGEGDDAFDPQQIVTARLRQPAERHGKLQPRHWRLEHDRKRRDAMRMLDVVE